MEDARSPPPTRPIFSAFAPPPCNHAACREARQAWILLARCDPEVPQALAKTTAELHDTLQDVAMDTYDHQTQRQLVVGFPHHPEPLEILARIRQSSGGSRLQQLRRRVWASRGWTSCGLSRRLWPMVALCIAMVLKSQLLIAGDLDNVKQNQEDCGRSNGAAEPVADSPSRSEPASSKLLP